MSYYLNCPEIAVRATVDKGFISFFDKKGKCLGRRDADYVEPAWVNKVMDSTRGVGSWVHTLYMHLIWKPLAHLSDMNETLA